MTVEFLPSVSQLPIAQIVVEQRLRPVSEDAVESLMAAIGKVDFITRILVRRAKKGDVLLDGAHRLEAMRRLGKETIPVVLVTCRDDEAALLETDANLTGADLTPLDLAVFLSARRRVYQEMHPETARGRAGAAARWMQEHSCSLASTIAAARGITVRQVNKIMAAGDAVAGHAHQLRRAPKPVTLKDLQAIGRIRVAPDRYAVIDALSEGRAKSAAEAVAQLKGPKPARDPNSAAQEKIAVVWSRAPMAAKRAFAADHADELRRLLSELEAE